MIRILLAVSDAAARRKIREELRLYEYRVLETDSREEAWRHLKEDGPDLLVWDAALEPHTNRGLLLRIRERWPELPVIAIGQSDTEREQLLLFDAGADEVLAPDFSVPVLARKIEVFLHRSGRMDPEEVRVGALRLNTETYQTFWQGRPVELTAKEFALLKALMKNKGRILTRLQLLDRIWGYDYAGEERVVDAHIKNLRRKLPASLIKTVKGIGYAIGDEKAAEEEEPEQSGLSGV